MMRRVVIVVSRALAALVVASCLCAAACAIARAEARTTVVHRAHARAHRAAKPRAPRFGMRAAIDPVTGRLVPRARVTDAPGAAPKPGSDAATAQTTPLGDTPTDMPVTTLKDGTQLAPLGPAQTQYEVARVGADGKLERACVQGDKAAAAVRPREVK
jgi:hypothetical protein